MLQAVNRFIFLNPPGISELTLISVLFAITLYSSIKSTERLTSRVKRISLIGIHSSSFLLIVFIILNPAIRMESYTEEKPSLAILVDHSWSMNLPADDEGSSRIKAVKNFLKKYEAFFSNIEKNFLVSYYVFDESLKPVSLDYINNNAPRGQSTGIENVLKELQDKHDLGGLDSVILFSDGADTVGSQFSQESLKNLGFTVYSVASFTGEQARDLWIDELKVSPVAFVRYPLSVEVVIKSAGFQDTNTPVILEEGDKLVSITQASISKDSGEATIGFVIQPSSVGRKVYTVSIPVISGDMIRENNRRSFVLDVIVNKIRVLHIAGSPSWDVKFLRQALKRNPNIDLVSFFILREATDLVFASQDELSLIPFPVDEIFGHELDTFDVVVFQNFDFRPYGIYGYHLERLRDFVMEKGGAFVLIGGDESFHYGDYGRTPLSEILPVELDYALRTIEGNYSEKEFHTKLTSAGTKHPVMKIIPDEKENEDNWNKMPSIDGLNRVQGTKSSAIPVLTTSDGEPVLVMNQVGSGKVASFLSDSSWKWIFVRGGEGQLAPYYEKFWNRLLLWLVNDPELKEVRVTTEKPSYNLGEKLTIRVRIFDPGRYDQDMESSIGLPSGNRADLHLKRTSPDEFNSEIHTEQYGVHQVNVKSAEVLEPQPESYGDDTLFLVEPPVNEVSGPSTDGNLLRMLAQSTRGHFITVGENPDQLQIDLSRKRTLAGYKTIPIWNNQWFFVSLLALFSTDWILRRRWGLR